MALIDFVNMGQCVHVMLYLTAAIVLCWAVSCSVSPKYAQEHQMAVIDCLEDPDETLKLKTLELLVTMTKANNVQVGWFNTPKNEARAGGGDCLWEWCCCGVW